MSTTIEEVASLVDGETVNEVWDDCDYNLLKSIGYTALHVNADGDIEINGAQEDTVENTSLAILHDGYIADPYEIGTPDYDAAPYHIHVEKRQAPKDGRPYYNMITNATHARYELFYDDDCTALYCVGIVIDPDALRVSNPTSDINISIQAEGAKQFVQWLEDHNFCIMKKQEAAFEGTSYKRPHIKPLTMVRRCFTR